MPTSSDGKTSLSKCVRCGGAHVIEWQPFERPIEIPEQPPLTHWAMCPTNNEPILMRVEVQEKICRR